MMHKRCWLSTHAIVLNTMGWASLTRKVRRAFPALLWFLNVIHCCQNLICWNKVHDINWMNLGVEWRILFHRLLIPSKDAALKVYNFNQPLSPTNLYQPSLKTSSKNSIMSNCCFSLNLDSIIHTERWYMC